MPVWLYLDQNYLSGMVKDKSAFAALETVLRPAVAAGTVAVPESPTHAVESAPRPDLPVLALLRSLSHGLRLPEPGARERDLRGRLAATAAADYPLRQGRASDELDLDALSTALPHCDIVTCDAHMADICRRLAVDRLYGCELYSGRRADVERLTERLSELSRAT